MIQRNPPFRLGAIRCARIGFDRIFTPSCYWAWHESRAWKTAPPMPSAWTIMRVRGSKWIGRHIVHIRQFDKLERWVQYNPEWAPKWRKQERG